MVRFYRVHVCPFCRLPLLTKAFGIIASIVDVAAANLLGDRGPRLVQFALKLLF